MANFTDTYEKKLLDGLVGTTQFSTPATTYLALFSSNPGDTGDVTNEISGNGYTRISLSGKFLAATGTDGNLLNNASIAFSTATADWLTITSAGIMESSTPGTDDMIMWFQLENPLTILNGEAFSLASGNMSLTVS